MDRRIPRKATRQEIEHIQNVIIYYKCELIEAIRTKLRLHEKKFMEMIQSKNDIRKLYLTEHEILMNELDAVNRQFLHNKENFLAFIEKAMN